VRSAYWSQIIEGSPRDCIERLESWFSMWGDLPSDLQIDDCAKLVSRGLFRSELLRARLVMAILRDDVGSSVADESKV